MYYTQPEVLQRRLLNRFKGEKLQKLCAFWFCKPEVLDDVQPKEYPSKSEKVVEFESWDKDKREKATKVFFQDHPQIGQYYGQVKSMRCFNIARLEQMRKIREYVKYHSQVVWGLDMKIKQFKKMIQQNEEQPRKEREARSLLQNHGLVD